jgi:energy-coupling factor transporter ATP-binding protein EcfA2
MKISTVVLHNFKKYEHARFNFHDQFTVLIGENGAGKTTILDALSVMLGTYLQGSNIKTGRGVIGKADARLFPVEKEGQIFLESEPEVNLTAEIMFRGINLLCRRDIGDRGGKAKELVNIAEEDRLQISRKESPDLPLLLSIMDLAGYGIFTGILRQKNPVRNWMPTGFALTQSLIKRHLKSGLKSCRFPNCKKNN